MITIDNTSQDLEAWIQLEMITGNKTKNLGKKVNH